MILTQPRMEAPQPQDNCLKDPQHHKQHERNDVDAHPLLHCASIHQGRIEDADGHGQGEGLRSEVRPESAPVSLPDASAEEAAEVQHGGILEAFSSVLAASSNMGSMHTCSDGQMSRRTGCTCGSGARGQAGRLHRQGRGDGRATRARERQPRATQSCRSRQCLHHV